MGQIAYDAATGEMMEAFSMTDEAWGIACQAPSGAILMPRTGWPAVPKVSIRGLRFFAHHPGCPDKLPAPESYAHTRLKIDIARTLVDWFQGQCGSFRPNVRRRAMDCRRPCRNNCGAAVCVRDPVFNPARHRLSTSHNALSTLGRRGMLVHAGKACRVAAREGTDP
ncbi:hypothetical protein AJ87_08930 [Rhizobium yanglingense]|nr:hypothetical protein AJ87_08930 [Rhizobium yanglingense]